MKFTESEKRKVIAALFIGIVAGNIFAPECTSKEHENIEKEIVSIKAENKTLEEKVKEAAPYFEMKENEKIEMKEANEKAEKERKEKEAEEMAVELSNGNYTAGVDFKEGTYNIEAVSGNGNVSSDNMFYGGINAIMGTGDSEFYQKEYKNIELPAGVVLKVKDVTIKLVPVVK